MVSVLACFDTKRGMYDPSIPHRDFLGSGMKSKEHPRGYDYETQDQMLLSDPYLSKVTLEQFMNKCEEIGTGQRNSCFTEMHAFMRTKGIPNEITNMMIGHLYHVPWNTAGMEDPLRQRIMPLSDTILSTAGH